MLARSILVAALATFLLAGCGGGGGGPTGCTSNAGCPSKCDVATGRCVECLVADDTCAPTSHCAAATNTCVAGCRADTGCPGAYCDVVAHQCVECLNPSQCALGYLCVDGACAAGCSPTHGCPGLQVCCAGACADLQTSPSNCNACGNACSFSSATATCVAGACALGTCTGTSGNCDGNPANGCETDLSATAAHCGTCGNACSLPAATAVCVAGGCEVGTCAAGRADCNLQPADGCEVTLATDPAHCGDCVTVCPARPNAAAACVASTCTVGACSPGFADCDGAAANGCETGTTSDATNCGACGVTCAVNEACVASACVATNDARGTGPFLAVTSGGESTVTGSTAHATPDGPFDWGCSSANGVWYRLALTSARVVYLDTAGSSFDTSIGIFAAASGTKTVANDDSNCTTGGFTNGVQSQVATYLAAGSYDILVTGCATGRFVLNYQELVPVSGNFLYQAPLPRAAGTTSTSLVGMGSLTGSCVTSAPSGEDLRWFTTCGARPSSFSLCKSDGGTYTRNLGLNYYDPVMYLRGSAGEVACVDDSSGPGIDCSGTGTAGSTSQFGPRIMGVTMPRGLGAVYVDSRTTATGMGYTLWYNIL